MHRHEFCCFHNRVLNVEPVGLAQMRCRLARVQSSMKNSEADGKRWLSQAENNLSAAELMAGGGFCAQACFLCHQVAGKSLKAPAIHS